MAIIAVVIYTALLGGFAIGLWPTILVWAAETSALPAPIPIVVFGATGLFILAGAYASAAHAYKTADDKPKT